MAPLPRHVLAEGETLTQHAIEASKKALEMAGVSAADVDMVLMATSSPDDLFGSACQVQVSPGPAAGIQQPICTRNSPVLLPLPLRPPWDAPRRLALT